VTSGNKSEPPASITEEIHCKRCGEAMALARVLSNFGDHPRFKLFRCVACGFYDVLKA
jgi:DNA-directed RNA polymerase subunit M/transcription elongation factor TFIIS